MKSTAFTPRALGFVLAASLPFLAACDQPTAEATAAGAQPGSAPADTEVVAVIGGKQVTLAQVDEKAKSIDMPAYQALYEARRRAIDEMIAEQLLDKVAAERGVTREALIEQIVDERGGTVTDAKIQEFYTQNQNRMGGRSLDDVKEQIRSFLSNQARAEAAQSYLEQLKQEAGVKVTLSPPRIEVEIAKDEPSKGPADAPVQIVEYSEYQCPFCSRVGPTLEQVVSTYGDRVRIVFRDFPLPMHPQAPLAAEAALCAGALGDYWAYHDKLFANQQQLERPALERYATELGLDAEKFKACLDGGEYRDDVQADMARGKELGVTGTPAFFINGRFISGAQPFESFAQIINEELERKGIEPPKEQG